MSYGKEAVRGVGELYEAADKRSYRKNKEKEREGNKLNFISIDIETSGLDPTYCEILEIAAIYNEAGKPLDELKSIHFYIGREPSGLILGEPYALAMNHEILSKIAKGGHDVLSWETFVEIFEGWMTGLEDSGSSRLKEKFVVAGKNFGAFDLQFMKKEPFYPGDWFRHRYLDPAMLYLEPGDKVPPDLSTCKKRAGLEEEVAHTAFEDALDVIKLLRHKGIGS